jgi:hypothetical protein
MHTQTISLEWRRFDRFIAARNAHRDVSCIYVQADREGRAIRVGKASKGLEARYRGGTGYALDAALHGSGNLWFAARVSADAVTAAEASLIWKHREQLAYNNMGKRHAPSNMVDLQHGGTPPGFG